MLFHATYFLEDFHVSLSLLHCRHRFLTDGIGVETKPSDRNFRFRGGEIDFSNILLEAIFLRRRRRRRILLLVEVSSASECPSHSQPVGTQPALSGELDGRQSLRDCLYVLSPLSWRRGRRDDQTSGSLENFCYSACPKQFYSMLKVPDHQVAGHRADGKQLGPLTDDLGRFYKPLQNGERGSKEVAFYTSFSSNTMIPDHIRRFFPVFHGTQLIEASDGSGLHSHLVMQDLVSSRFNPTLIDIKIGSRTWYPEASEEYIQKCLKRDRECTSLPLGFKICGLQIYGSKESGFWKPDKKLVQDFSTEDVRTVLKKLVSSNSFASSHLDLDCCFASTVYGGSTGILAQLLELKAWFEDQTIFQFNSCSVLMMYEKEAIMKGGLDAEVKLVDFAHVVEGSGVIDHNFLGGLCSLIKFISEILTV